MAIVKAQATSAFAIVSATGSLSTSAVDSTDPVDNGKGLKFPCMTLPIIIQIDAQHLLSYNHTGVLAIHPATAITDYYDSDVQTIHPLTPVPTDLLFQGVMDYDIALSECAVLSKADWVVMDPLGSSGASMGGGEEEETGPIQEETVEEPEGGGGPGLQDGGGETYENDA